ncbi:MAG: hypothetical protein ABIZ91_13170 [Gemmatimonadaceae bacterium]
MPVRIAVCAKVVLIVIITAVSAAAQNRPVATQRALVGEIALEFRAQDHGRLLIGLAGPERALTLDVRASDARRWADSAARLLAAPRRARARAKGAATVARVRVILEEPGAGGGSLILARVDSAATRTWVLFAADTSFAQIRQSFAQEEAAILARIVRRAATNALPPPPRKRTRPAPKTPVKTVSANPAR